MSFGITGLLVVIGPLDLRHPVLAAQDDGDLVQVEAEQHLQLPYPGDPGQVVLGVAAGAARGAGARRDQADLLVVTQGPLGDPSSRRRGSDAEQRPVAPRLALGELLTCG
jgi:hypothetical protein